ncbi:MBL fold metallo-hydrolase [Halalkalibacter okhensis]|uniref:MBL fold metallo-hydrolase n=1 Tax=Halalkalibacter okhensis TaxID=333138 RepID=UPI000690F2A7|nr:MBL fold metallo-hydrolase [Halalkalibacter okhensis]
MIFRQYLHSEPIAASYFFGCGGQSTGAIVDPLLEDVDFYIEESKRLGMEISYIFDTHLHADHLSGARLLAEKTGAKYVLHESAQTSFNYYSVKDNDQIILGNVVVDIMHTPGHTPEHISLVVTDKTRGAEPWFVLTGHTLMVGDVGRTELASDVEEGASQLYDSIFNKLVTLDDHIEVYPNQITLKKSEKQIWV